MDKKKLITGIVGFLLIGIAIYFGITKFVKKPNVNTGSGTGTGTGSESGTGTGTGTVVEQPIIDVYDAAIARLSNSTKADIQTLAMDIYEDMNGWRSHDMRLYEKLNTISDDAFIYFVLKAFPVYTSTNIVKRLTQQNWEYLTKESKNLGYNEQKAGGLIAKIISRYNNL